MFYIKSVLHISILVVFAVVLVACGDSSNNTDITPANLEETPNSLEASPNSLQESLNTLGVDTEVTERLDSQGNPYPDTYAPLGKIATVRQIDPVDADEPTYIVGRPEELFLGGFRLNSRQFIFSSIDDITIAGLNDEEAKFVIPDVLEGRPLVEAEWGQEPGNHASIVKSVPSGTRRDAAALDTNGDGFLTSVLAYAIELPDGSDEVRLQIIDGNDSTPVLDFGLFSGGRFLPAYDLRVAGGDFDGDGRDELAIVVARQPLDGVFDTPIGLYLIDDAMADFAVIDEHSLTFSASFGEPYITLGIESFHADHDDRDELAVVVNESQLYAPTPGNYASHFFVYDVSNGSLEEIASGPITATVYDSDGLPRTATAVITSITTEDLNDDSLDELIFAGFEEIVESCKYQDEDAGINKGSKYLLVAYGGRYNDFAPIRAGASEVEPPNCKYESSSEPYIMRFAHVNALDFDGDGDMDIQINDMVLDEIPLKDWSDSLIANITDITLIYGPDTNRPYYDRSESIITVSDQTGDGVKDIIALYHEANDNEPYIKIYSWDDEAENGYRLATRILVEEDDLQYKNPIIVPMDVDNDKVALLQYTGEYFMDITEPMVLAVIASAPCKRDIGQDSCYSSWGSSQTGAVGRSFSVEVYGSAGAGAGAAGVGAFGKWLAKVNASASLETSSSYELSKSQTFSTGPLEDGVVFTSIPVDRYFYELIRDNTDRAGTLGQRIEIRLPRTPDMRIVELTYYNSSITADAEQIDDRVFNHIPGDPFTYPDTEEKDDQLEVHQSIVQDYRENVQRTEGFELLPAERGLEVGPVLVGQGGGATELGLEYTETVGAANALAMGFSFEAEMLFGAAVSWEVGIEFGSTITVSHGDSTLYSGSVDSIDPHFYATNLYRFGLFAYLQRLGDQEIEVLNFWVEE